MLGNEAETAADTVAMRQVVDLQRRAGGWFFLMYSLYWRRHIAFYLGESDHGIILQAGSPDELWQLMDGVAPPGWQVESLPRLTAGSPSETVSVRAVLSELPRGRG
jgi:hypothetical protein